MSRRLGGVLGLLGAGLLAASAGVHLDLYLTGYSAVAAIGVLFLLQFALGVVVALGLVLARRPVVFASGALLSLGTLAGYLLSLHVGLFGFHEVRTSAGVDAGVVELAAIGVLGAGALVTAGSAPARRWFAAGSTAALAAGAVAFGAAVATAPRQAATSGGGRATVVAAAVQGYGEVLATAGPAGRSLYLLSDEAGGRIACTGGCLSIWPPLLVGPGVRPRPGPGVSGLLGVLHRGDKEQVTYNGYPLYGFAGDGAPHQASGEGIVSNGGTWYLVRASSRTASDSPVTSRRPG